MINSKSNFALFLCKRGTFPALLMQQPWEEMCSTLRTKPSKYGFTLNPKNRFLWLSGKTPDWYLKNLFGL